MKADTAINLVITAAALGAGYWFIVRPLKNAGSAAADVLKEQYSEGGDLYEIGDWIQERLIIGTDSLGTKVYEIFNDDYDPNQPAPNTGGASGEW